MARLTKISLQIFKLALIGGFASAVDFVILLALTLSGLAVWFSGAIGFAVGTLIVYFVANRFVFNATKPTHRTLEISFFFAAGLLGLMLNSIILEVGVNALQQSLLAAKISSIFIVFIWNTAARYSIIVLFRRKSKADTVHDFSGGPKLSGSR